MTRNESIHHNPELMYLSPTTREKAIMIAQELLQTRKISSSRAIRQAIEIAKSWAVKSIDRKVWKKLKFNEKDLL
ncbi:hypothetical protein CLV98_103426 [Dyadobacter jejuensis]|uniref:Uncharacterized protein n=1 Tax=Dyadobacter jejuensis TaxID=1082580 RepID=A0A316AMU7_9BACT|nr:hypothetical protein [Dyadobacter jejuensis]PWJ59053.1 hypothetical protein CLV98_103426 [Dyadobacter jejuensis]